MSGPVSEGSIFATITADSSDYTRKLDEAQAKAEELGRTDPTIEVKASVTDALAKIEAVRTAESQIGGTGTGSGVNPQMSAALDRLRAAELALTEADLKSTAATDAATAAEDRRWRTIQSGIVSEADKQAAIDAATKATLKAELAAVEYTAAEDRVSAAARKVTETAIAQKAAQQAATDAQLKDAAAQLASANAKDSNNKAAGAQAGYLQTIALAVAATIPLMGDAAAFTVGWGGALGALGVAGMAAVKGISADMAAGTSVGQQYASGLDLIKQDLAGVGDSAASGLLVPFNRAIQDLQPMLPVINQDMSVFAGIAGNIGDNVLTALGQGFQTMLPLILEASHEIEGVSQDLAGFSGSSQFQGFVQYGMTAMPQFLNLLTSLGTVVEHVVEALAPLGSVAVPLITDLATAIDMIPIPVLTTVASSAAGIATAFGTWSLIKPLVAGVSTAMGQLGLTQAAAAVTAVDAAAAETGAAAATTALGAAIDFATGPVGIIAGLLGAAAAAWGLASQNAKAATQATTSYTAAIQQDSGAIGDNTKALLAKTLQTDGALIAADQLGISESLVMKAALGNTSAQKQLSAALAGVKQSASEAAVAHTATDSSYQKGVTTAQQNTAAYRTLKDAVDKQAASMKLSLQMSILLNEAQGMAPGPARAEALAAQDVTNKLNAQAQATTALTNALTLLNGGSLNLMQAQTSQAAAINSVSSSFKTNKLAIDGNSAAAVANQQAIQASVTATQAIAQATLTATGSQDKATRAALNGKAALEQQLRAQGYLTPSVQHYIDTIKWIPTKWTTKLNADTAAAAATVASYKALIAGVPRSVQSNFTLSGVAAASAALNSISGQLMSINSSMPIAAAKAAHAVAAGALGAGHSAGGTITGPRNAFSDAAGLYPLADGEEVISNRQGQASKYRPLLKAINAGKDPMVPVVSGGMPSSVTVSLAGTTITANIDGQPIKLLIQEQVVQGINRAGAEAYMAVMGGSTL